MYSPDQLDVIIKTVHRYIAGRWRDIPSKDTVRQIVQEGLGSFMHYPDNWVRWILMANNFVNVGAADTIHSVIQNHAATVSDRQYVFIGSGYVLLACIIDGRVLTERLWTR